MASDERSSDEPAAAPAETPPESAPPPSTPFESAAPAVAPPPRVAPSDDPFGPLPAGALVGKYEIAGILGQGAFGITYLARDTQLRRDVAVKEYLPTAFAKRQGGSTVVPRSQHTADDFQWGRDRFVDEARTLASLEDAPGIVNVHDFMEANGTAYMVMALVRGETVEARLKRETRLPEAVIARMLPPLLDGLELVHAAGFLHRDIKPANILLDPAGRPTLIDFGASRVALEARTQVMTAVYTPGYAPFEQSSSAKQGPWTDVYALCATLYHCVDGSPPPSAIDRMVEERLKPAAEMGKGRYAPALLAGIDAGLKLRAPDRPQTIADLRRVFKGFGGTGSPHHATAHPAPADDRAAARRGRAPMWIAAGVAALALAGGGAWYATRPPTDLDLASERARRVAADEKARTDAEAARRAAAAEAERKAAAETTERQRVAEDAARKAEAERIAAEAAARQRIAAEIARNTEAQKAAAEE
ncbi:MAG: serine/threonine protein kinase, partial [Rhodospirillales bacterium]|nr:serine/threonine protein kinase [Rhodospirillales bacterium]